MTEKLRESAEFDPTLVAKALRDWLQEEIENSMIGRNAILDDWSQFKRDLKLPFDDFRNQDAGKARSHYDRLATWTLASEEYPDLLQDDYFIARQMFCAQMFISGAFRKQCFLEAGNAEEYIQKRKNHGPTGINIEESVTTRLNDHQTGNAFLREPYKNTPEAQLIEKTLHANDTGLELSKDTHSTIISNPDSKVDVAIPLLMHAQDMWSRLIVDYIFYSALSKNGQLDNVPMLQPKSISENPQIYYPFKIKD
jgi:hypothetical protein